MGWIGLVLLLFFNAGEVRSAAVYEAFGSDPAAAGRFQIQTVGTESSFTHLPEVGRLRAVLDVDAATAYYLSPPLQPFTERDSVSFSFLFRVDDVDDRVPPTSFIGLMTPQHVENFGDGLTVNLATTAGGLVATASVDAAGVKTEGSEIPLQTGVEYLAAASYSPIGRRFTVDVYSGRDFVIRVGRSEAVLPAEARVQLTHLGLQNGGARTVDSTVGSLTLVLDELALPGRPPIILFAEDTEVTEGTDGASSAVVQVLLSVPSNLPVSVDYATADGTAVAGNDYAARAGTLVIPAGATGARVTIPVVPDGLAEEDETFELLLLRPVNAILAVDRVTLTLLDDDQPQLDAGSVEILEGTSGDTPVQVPVRLSNPSVFPVEARYATFDGTAASGTDYRAGDGVVRFAPGEVERNLMFTVLGDALAEGNEWFGVRLSQGAGARLGQAEGRVTILDDDAPPILDVSDISVVEGNAGPVTAVVPVRLSHPSAQPVQVRFHTADETASAGADYLAVSGQLTLGPGEVEGRVSVTVLGDTLEEGTETFRLILQGPTQAVLGRSEAIISILDDDNAPALRVSDATVVEGPSGQNVAMSFEVRLWPPASLPVTVNYATAGQTATAGVDFESASGSLNFPAGVTHRTVTVTVVGDDEAEPDETLVLRLSQSLNAGMARGEGLGTILTDDSVTLSVADIEVTESDGVDVQAVFLVTLRGQPIQPVSVAYFTANDTAQAGLDYRAAAGLLVFDPGQTVRSVSVPVLGDFEDEPTEQFEFRLHSAVGATLSRVVATARILDNDPPSLSVGNVTVVEGSGGPTNARVVVRMSSPTFEDIQVEYLILERTATAGVDYLPVTGVLTFPVGTQERFIDVTIVGDTLHEGDETFVVRLVRPLGATLAVPEALVTIRDDDPAPVITIEDREVTECSGGTASVFFVVSLSAPSAQPVTVNYWTFDETAVAGEDYVAVQGTLVFPPGVTEQWIEVPLICDMDDEGTEGFGVGLGGGSGGFIGGTGRGRGRILDDDPPQVSVFHGAVDEGDDGLVQARFRLSLSSASGDEVTVEFFTSDETATAGADYAAVSGRVNFPPGSQEQEVTVPVFGDTLPEGNETFLVTLAHPLHANLGVSQARGTIRDDDQPLIRPEDVSVVEGNQGTHEFVLPVRLNRTSPQTVEVRYATVDLSARAGVDYQATAGILRFAPGEMLGEIPLVILGDEQIEGNETFRVQFFDPLHGILMDEDAQVTVVDDDGAPVLTVADVPIDEGDAGVRSLVFSLRLSAVSAAPVSLRYATADLTATAGSDYVMRSGTLTFSPGVTNQTLAIPVLGDTLFEPDETFLLVLTEPVNTVLARSQALGILRNDDLPSVVTADDGSVLEGAPGTRVPLTFRVTLQPPNAVPVSVPYVIHPGTATAGADFEPASGTVVFPAGNREQFVQVTVLGDAETEGNETLFLRLGTPVGATLGRAEALGTIIDDEGIEIRVADAEAIEPDSGTIGMSFVVSLARPGTQLITVAYTTVDGTALSGQDYTAVSGTLFFPLGLTRQTLTVPILGDLQDEPDETFEVRLSNAANGIIQRAVAAGLIRDNDPPAVSIDDVMVVGSQTGAVDAQFSIRLSSATTETVTVAYHTENGTATAGTDYSEAAGTLVFSPGQVLRTLDIQVKGNTLDEDTEFFLVHLDEPVNATAGRMTGRGTILNRILLNQPPQVAIVSPSTGSAFVSPVHLTVIATASDAEGPLAEVEFFAGTQSLGSDASAPFSVLWPTVPSGVHTLTARATDGGGLVTTSAPVRITVSLPNQPPTLEPPPPASTLEDTPTGPLLVRVHDLDTPAELLELEVETLNPELVAPSGLKLGGQGASRSLTILPEPDQFGVATLQFRVRDVGGLVTSQTFPLTITPVNDAPTLDPLPDRIIQEDAPLQTVVLSGIGTGAANEVQTLTVAASSSQSSLIPAPIVTYSSPQAGGTLSFQPRPDSHGTAIISVIVRDNGGTAHGGQDTLVRQFTVTVSPVNDPPTIRWLDPAPGATFTTGSSIPLLAEASDPDDGVALVEFLLGSQVLGQFTRPPYQITWPNAPAGTHTLVARVRDFAGANASTPPLQITVTDPARSLPEGDILLLRNQPHPELDILFRYLDESYIQIRDSTHGHLRKPIIVIADRADLELERLLTYRAIIWNDLGLSGTTLGDREIELLYQAWQFGIPIYFIGLDLGLAQPSLAPATRQRWTDLTGLVPSSNSTGPGTVAALEPRERSSELFWGSLDETRTIVIEDFPYAAITRPGRLIGDGEVRALMDAQPILTRYPAFNSPFDNDPRRLLQAFLVTDPPAASLESRRHLFLNGVVWLLGGECDNFLTQPFCFVLPPDPAAGPCIPHTAQAILANNGRCQARGTMVTLSIPSGFEVASVRIQSEPAGVNGGIVFHREHELVFALGRIEPDTRVILEADLLPPGPGDYQARFTTTAHYRQPHVCITPFTVEGPGCARPRLEARLGLAGFPEFRVAEPASGTVTIEVSHDLLRWTPAGSATAGAWLPIQQYVGADGAVPNHTFIRIGRNP